MNAVSEFLDDLASAGITVTGEIIADGQLHRAHVSGDKPGAKNLVYKIYDDEWPSWYFCDHKRGIEATGTSKVARDRNRSPAEIEELRRKAAKAKKQRERELAQRHAERAEYCATLTAALPPANDNHPYLKAKAIPATKAARFAPEIQAAEFFDGAEPRIIRDALVLPLYNTHGKVQSIQLIQPDGQKLFCSGASVAGAYHPIKGDSTVTLICEGYATGVALHQATGYSVACAMSAGNLEAVADLLRRKYPDGQFVIAADNDHATENNPGITHGRRAAVKHGLPIVAPDFGTEPKPGETDWDDWLRVRGSAQELADLIRKAVNPADEPALPAPANPAALYHWADVDLTIPAKYSELSVSKQFAASFSHTLRWVEGWKTWMIWTGKRWQHDRKLLAMENAKRLCAAVADYAVSDFIEFTTENQKRTVIEKYGSARTIGNVLTLSKSDPTIAAEVDQWDADPWLLNTPAGTVNLRTGETRPARIEDYLTKSTSASPGGDCPTWLSFLDTATGSNPELIGFLRRMVGYCLTGSVRDHALFFVYGAGGNGKGTFLNVIERILAGYATASPMDTFTESRDKSHPTELARMVGARLVTAQETEEGKRWAEDRIKALTGGDTITARFMNRDFFEYRPQFKLVFAGNHRPSLRNVDEAIRRRLYLIPFTVTPPKKDPDLAEKLLAESGGILAWAIEGCMEWQRVGLCPPEIVRAATDEYLAEQDTIGTWIADSCVTGPGFSAKSSALYANYKAWCDDAGEFTLSQKRWAAIMTNRGFATYKNSTTYYAGIGVKSDASTWSNPF